MTQAARLLEDFYPDHVISRLSKPEQDFWEDRHLEANDWQGTLVPVELVWLETPPDLKQGGFYLGVLAW